MGSFLEIAHFFELACAMNLRLLRKVVLIESPRLRPCLPVEQCAIHAALQDGVTRTVGDEVFWRSLS
jgi:hypothetical protein